MKLLEFIYPPSNSHGSGIYVIYCYKVYKSKENPQILLILTPTAWHNQTRNTYSSFEAPEKVTGIVAVSKESSIFRASRSICEAAMPTTNIAAVSNERSASSHK